MWHKLEMVEAIIKEGIYDWIWWIDMDTLITNTTVKLEDIIIEALGSVNDPDNVDVSLLFVISLLRLLPRLSLR